MLFGVGVRVGVSSEGRIVCSDYSNLCVCETPAVVVFGQTSEYYLRLGHGRLVPLALQFVFGAVQ